jgi:hypothetical protein
MHINLFSSAAADDSTPQRRGRGSVSGHGDALPLNSTAHDDFTPMRRGRGSVSGHGDALSLNTPDRTPVSTPASSVQPSPFAPQVREDVPPAFDTKRERTAIAGPTRTSNWVVRDRLCCGAAPNHAQPRTFAPLVSARFDTMVCVMENEAAATGYIAEYRRQSGVDTRVLFFAMKDGEPIPNASVESFLQFADQVVDEIVAKRKVYVHCQQGHGRTGLVVSAVLAKMYGVSGMKAVNFCDALHSCREDTQDQSSPQTQEQRVCAITMLTPRTVNM